MIFLDTGAFVGRYIERDQYHRRAVAFWERIAAEREPYWTSNFVLDEVLALLGRMAGNRFACDRAHAIYASNLLTIVRPDEAMERDALSYFAKYADQRVSFTDCISFAIMKRHGLKRVFTFDEHFRLIGFKVCPGAGAVLGGE